jgi:Spy/CpxP family protein refolding chaperone
MCSFGKMETEKHFILECEALKDSRENYVGILAANSWDNLFSKEVVEKLGAIIVKLHRKRAEYKSQMEKQSIP